MDILYFLIPTASVLAIAAFCFFFWATKTGQFEDLDTPPLKILFEETPINNKEKK